MPTKTPARDVYVTDDDGHPAARNERFVGVVPYVVKLVQEFVVALYVAELARVVVVLLQPPVGRGRDDKVDTPRGQAQAPAVAVVEAMSVVSAVTASLSREQAPESLAIAGKARCGSARTRSRSASGAAPRIASGVSHSPSSTSAPELDWLVVDFTGPTFTNLCSEEPTSAAQFPVGSLAASHRTHRPGR